MCNKNPFNRNFAYFASMFCAIFLGSNSVYPEVVKDANASLYWQKCSLGLQGEACKEGVAWELPWDQALKKCQEIQEKGMAWRLPSLEELSSLVTEKKQTPRIDPFLFPETLPKNYWAAEDAFGRKPFINFFSGDSGSYSSSIKKGFIRCVANSSTNIDYSQKKFIKTIQGQLPPNWFLSLETNKLTLERGQKAWKYMENKSNSHEPPDEKKIKKIMKHGELLICRFVFALEEKWSDTKLQELKTNNQKVRKEIENLPEKWNIAHLKNQDSGEYLSEFSEEKKKIESYKQEKKRLEAFLHPIPDFEWDGVYFFIIEKTGLEEDYYSIYPNTAIEESRKIWELFKDKGFRYIE